jgi:hypothetical protein
MRLAPESSRLAGARPPLAPPLAREDLKAMIATLDLGDLRGLRDRAILLVGFARVPRRTGATAKPYSSGM